MQKIKARFQAMIVLYYFARVNHKEGKGTAKINGKETFGKQWMPEEEQE